MQPMHRRPPLRVTASRVALLVVLAAGVASCRLLPFGDRMPDPEAPPPAGRSQAAEATQLPPETPGAVETPPSATEPPATVPSPSIEIPPPIN